MLPRPSDEFPLIYRRCYRFTGRKTGAETGGGYKGERFFHDFGKNSSVFGVERGSLLTLPSGRIVRLSHRVMLIVNSTDDAYEEE